MAVRGIKLIPVEQVRWLKTVEQQISEMGAEYLGQKIRFLLEAIDQDDNPARRMYDLLTTLKVFERLLTLQAAKHKLEQLVSSDATSSD